MTSGNNIIHFLAVSRGNIPIIAIMFLGKRNSAGGSFNYKTDSQTYASLYIPLNKQGAHYIVF